MQKAEKAFYINKNKINNNRQPHISSYSFPACLLNTYVKLVFQTSLSTFPNVIIDSAVDRKLGQISLKLTVLGFKDII